MAVQAAPLHFPEFGEVPETKRHLKLRTLLFEFLELAFAHQNAVGCDQFVYWDAADPRVCLAPDAFVRLGEPDSLFGSWKVWEHSGPPHVAIEISSSDDSRDRDWKAKLARYARLGVLELVRFDAETSAARLRIWDRKDAELVERDLATASAMSSVLPGFWLEVAQPNLGPTLRLSRDEGGLDLYLTKTEQLEILLRQANQG
ncbi:MAG TPA: Uma2 family endonuclease [Polyangiaceae bacterium]|nr:Uma2 family endonuclease [Polyangiaceae bacterium]